ESDSQLDAILAQTRSLRVGLPTDATMPQIGPLISTAAAEQLKQTYDDLVSRRCEPLVPWQTDSRRANLVYPAIVDATHCSDEDLNAIGALEWFGPLLVIQHVRDFESALRAAANTPYGLAAALLGGSAAMFETFVDRVGAGVVNWNGPTTGAAGNLPFGGLGDSGNHRPAGFHAIDFCSDPVASLQTDSQSETLQQVDLWNVAK
ncbi:MAG: aldehyde dehydrogenase family protein, partial [Novipirellula sp. JB048]